MTEKRILFATAQIAKSKDFHWHGWRFFKEEQEFKRVFEGVAKGLEGNWCYNDKEVLICPKMYNKTLSHYPAPSQGLLQKWLRETHKIDVTPLPEYKLKRTYTVEIVYENEGVLNIINPGGVYDVYEDAFEFGLQHALNLIK